MESSYAVGKRKLVVPLTLAVVVACVVVCLGAYFLALLSPDPVSPPASHSGSVPTFDAVLARANQTWSFLFRIDDQIVATDVYAERDVLVLDIVEATHNASSELLGVESLSPEGNLLAVAYFSERDLSDYWHPPIGQLLVVEVVSGRVTTTSTSLEGFQFDWTVPVHWLGSSVVLIKMHRFLGTDMSSEEVVYVRRDLNDIWSDQVIAFGPCSLSTVPAYTSQVLLLASDCEPLDQRVVWAVDINGKRPATDEEQAFFDQTERNLYPDWRCRRGCTNEFGANLRSQPVVDALDCFTKYCENNWNLHYVFLNDRLVRIADGFGSPRWDSELELYIWGESDHTYYMDNLGHYRAWHGGEYLEKIPIVASGN